MASSLKDADVVLVMVDAAGARRFHVTQTTVNTGGPSPISGALSIALWTHLECLYMQTKNWSWEEGGCGEIASSGVGCAHPSDRTVPSIAVLPNCNFCTQANTVRTSLCLHGSGPLFHTSGNT